MYIYNEVNWIPGKSGISLIFCFTELGTATIPTNTGYWGLIISFWWSTREALLIQSRSKQKYIFPGWGPECGGLNSDYNSNNTKSFLYLNTTSAEILNSFFLICLLQPLQCGKIAMFPNVNLYGYFYEISYNIFDLNSNLWFQKFPGKVLSFTVKYGWQWETRVRVTIMSDCNNITNF